MCKANNSKGNGFSDSGDSWRFLTSRDTLDQRLFEHVTFFLQHNESWELWSPELGESMHLCSVNPPFAVCMLQLPNGPHLPSRQVQWNWSGTTRL